MGTRWQKIHSGTEAKTLSPTFRFLVYLCVDPTVCNDFSQLFFWEKKLDVGT